MDGTGPSNSVDDAPLGLGARPSAVKPSRSSRVGLVVALLIGLGFAGLLAVRVKQATQKRAALEGERTVTQEKGRRKEPARLVRPVAATWTPRVDVTGSLKPWREADVGFETQGRLVRVAVATGDKVSEGQLLAVLDGSRAVAQVGQADSQVKASEANLALAQDTMKRTEALAATKSVPEAQVEQARQQVALARAQLDGAAASARLARTGAGQSSISSPFAGIVTRAPTGIGSVVNPGVALIHIEDTARFRLSVTVGEEDVPLVKTGAPVQVVYREFRATGKVVAVVPSLDQATRRAPVEIEVPNDGHLLAWGFVKARIGAGAPIKALRLPAEARRPGSQDEVVVASGGRARLAKVSFAVDEDGSLVVQRGLLESDEVVLSPSVELKDGDAL